METNVILAVIVLLQIVLIILLIVWYRTRSEGKFELEKVKTSKDMQKYLQMLDDKFEGRYQDIDEVIDTLKQKMDEFGQKTEKHADESAQEVKKILTESEKNFQTKNDDLIRAGKALEEKTERFDDFVSEIKTMISATMEETDKRISDLLSSEMKPIVNHIFHDSKRLSRYEKGYDIKILEKFLTNIFTSLDYIKREREKNDRIILKNIEEDLLVILRNSGIYRLELSEGDLYTDDLDHFVDIEFLPTTVQEKVNRIEKIHRYGYYKIYLNNNNEKIKTPVRVARISVNQIAIEGEE